MSLLAHRSPVAWLSVVTCLLLGVPAAPAGAAPGWSSAASAPVPASDLAAARLADGRVLLVGGRLNFETIRAAEIYDPATNTWTTAADPPDIRSGGMLTVLHDGRAMVTGGSAAYSETDAVSVYAPTTDTWSLTADPPDGFRAGQATLLADGRVLMDNKRRIGPLAQIYDPATDTWSSPAQPPVALQLGPQVRLTDGRVLKAGGGGYGATTDVSIYDPRSNTWTSAPGMSHTRDRGQLIRLADGDVLAVGGYDGATTPNQVTAAERYDPVSDRWSSAGVLPSPAYSDPLVRMDDGSVIVAAGTIDRYDPAANSWTLAGHGTPANRHGNAAVLLENGSVFIAKGDGDGGTPINRALATAEIRAPYTSLVVSPLNFGEQTIATTGTGAVPVHNTGSAPLIVGTPTIAGPNAADYGVALNGCGPTVAPGGTCLMVVRFDPHATGLRTAWLSFQDSTVATSHSVPLTGVGHAAPAPGPKGDTGPRGPKGAKGARGRDAKVHCTIRKLKRTPARWRVSCHITYSKGTRAGTVRARMLRRGRSYARGQARLHGRRVTVHLRTTRRLRHGRYRLSVTLSTRGGNAARTVAVRVR